MFDKRIKITYDSLSYIGDRERNEDTILVKQRGEDYCFVVADGLGGHGLGDAASQMLAAVFEREFETARDNRSFIETAFDSAQREILASQREQGARGRMKTTAAVLSIINGRRAWGHIGDSRLYCYWRNKLDKRTIDHSVPQKLALAGAIKESEIATHPDRARILCAVGDDWEKPMYEISKEKPLRRGESFLLCTDGFWEYIPYTEPAAAPGQSADEWLRELLKKVEGAGTDMDNYSAISVIVR